MLDALEIDPAWLPRVLESPEVAGETARRRARRRGRGRPGGGRARRRRRRRGRPGVGRARDVRRRVRRARRATRPTPRARVHAFCHAVPGAWHVMGVMLSAAGLAALAARHDRRRRPYDELVAGAEAWEPGVEGLLFAPYLAGERTPYPDPDARGAFLGLGLRHDRGALTRAVLEGVAFGLRDALDLVVEMGGRPASGRVSGGGGARHAVARDRRLGARDAARAHARVDEGAAYGAALLGGVAAGVWGDAREAVERLRAGDAHDRAAARLGGALRRAAAGVPAGLPGAGGGARGLTGASLCGVRRPCLVGACGFLHDCALSCGVWPPYENCWARSAARRSSAGSSSEGKVRAAELSADLGVSLDTVRRDLAELAAAGALRRVHGGALPPASPGPGASRSACPTTSPRRRAIAAAAVGARRARATSSRSAAARPCSSSPAALPDDLEATVLATSPDIAVALADPPVAHRRRDRRPAAPAGADRHRARRRRGAARRAARRLRAQRVQRCTPSPA